MSLDVTPGMPSSPGAGPPLPSPLAGAATAGPPGADMNSLFAALLAGQGQTTSATVPAKAATASPPPSLESSPQPTTPEDEPKIDRDKKEAAPNDPNLDANWLLMPAPLPMQTPQAPIIETTAATVSDTPAVSAAVIKLEVMDTVSASTSPAPAGKDALPNSELLPISSVVPVPMNAVANSETRTVAPDASPQTAAFVTPNAMPAAAPPASIVVPLPTEASAAVPPVTMPVPAEISSPALVAATAIQPLTTAAGIIPAVKNALATAPAGLSSVSSAQPSAFPLPSELPVVPASVGIVQLSSSRPTAALTPQTPVPAALVTASVTKSVKMTNAPVPEAPQTNVVTVPTSPTSISSGAERVPAAGTPIVASEPVAQAVISTAPADVLSSAGMAELSMPAAPTEKPVSHVTVPVTVPQLSAGVSAPQSLPQSADTPPATLVASVSQDDQLPLSVVSMPSTVDSGDVLQSLQTVTNLEVQPNPLKAAQTKPTAQIIPAPKTASVPQAVPALPITGQAPTALISPTAGVPQTAAVQMSLSPDTQAAALPVSSQSAPLENAPKTANNTSSSVVSASAVPLPAQTSLTRPAAVSSGISVPADPSKETLPTLALPGEIIPAHSAEEQAKTNTDSISGDISSTPWASGLVPTLDQNDTAAAGKAASSGPVTQEDRAQMMSQVADTVGTLRQRTAPGGESQMSLQLHPKEWGEMQVSVRMQPTRDADGVPTTAIVAHVVASSPAVKTALELHSSELHRTLQDAGLRLDRLTVTVQSVTSSGQSQTTAGGGHAAFSGSRGDLWQPPQPQRDGSTTSGGNSSTFSAFSESRQGRSFNGQQSSAAYGTQDDAEGEAFPTASRLIRSGAGFDQRV